MTDRKPSNMLSFIPTPEIFIQVLKIPDLADFLLHRPLAQDYQTQRPVIFDKKNFKQEFLLAEELGLLNGFKAMKKQNEWLCGRFAIKFLVKETLTAAELPERLTDIRIEYREQGAPFLTSYPDCCISLSHSGIYTAAAVALPPGITMGIDLEKIGKQPDISFMKTAFTEDEIRDMGDSPYDIFRHWTLKEAYLKYIRLGFNESLHHVEIIKNKVLYRGRAQNLTCWSRERDHAYVLSMVSDPAP